MALVSAPRNTANAMMVFMWYGDSAPVDGVSGTLAGVAEKSSLYCDLTNSNLYINGGTQASPTWKLITRAP